MAKKDEEVKRYYPRCAKCGSRRYSTYSMEENETTWYMVKCDRCGFRTPWDDSKKSAREHFLNGDEFGFYE